MIERTTDSATPLADEDHALHTVYTVLCVLFFATSIALSYLLPWGFAPHP